MISDPVNLYLSIEKRNPHKIKTKCHICIVYLFIFASVYKKELVNNRNLNINFVAEEFENIPEEAEIEKETNEAAVRHIQKRHILIKSPRKRGQKRM